MGNKQRDRSDLTSELPFVVFCLVVVDINFLTIPFIIFKEINFFL
jgi:hypothetical protein